MRKLLSTFAITFLVLFSISFTIALSPQTLSGQGSSKCCCDSTLLGGSICDGILGVDELFLDGECVRAGGTPGPPSTYDPNTLSCNGNAADRCFSACSPLPVEFVDFTFKRINGGIVLAWSTLSESNNSHFEVQQSADREDFLTIGRVEGSGTSTERSDYSYLASGIEPGTHRFRIMQVDFDGSFDFSPEIEYVEDLPADYVMSTAFPNPFKNQTTIRLRVADRQQVRVEVFDLQGRMVESLHDGILAANKAHQIYFDASALPNGHYLYRAVGEFFVSESVRMTKID